ncbi:MAG TPA: PAS domain S-box protein, partial [Desulfobacteria bacterium]|nr:PAS domain S-box protein [Desulfobacteria bacterium]
MSLQPWLEIITDGFLALDKDLKITYVNHAAGKILSTSTDLLIGKELVDLTQDEFFQRCLDECQNALTRKKQRSVTIDYGPKSLELNVFPAEEHLNVLVKDSSERVFASEKLSASEELFATAFTASPIPMLIIGLEDGELVEVNKSFQDLTGYSRNQLVGKTSKLVNVDLDGPKNFNLRERIYKEHSIDNYEVEFVTSTGENRVGLYTFNLIKGGNEEQILAACTDITRFRRMQMEMARLDRLDLIGVLAAGLGHEIRNPLTTVRGFLQLLG